MNSKKNFPVIILFEPQLEENIGAVARAMLNFNFHNIRIIKKGWKPTKVSFKNSAKADEILKKAEVFKNLEDAINDLNYVFATSNRKRDLNTDIIEIPLNKSFKSLNLAQSVLLVVYELFNLKFRKTSFTKVKKAKKEELFIFFSILEKNLQKNSFFKVKEKKEIMMRNIKTIFNKAELTEKEIKILLGITKNLAKEKKKS